MGFGEVEYSEISAFVRTIGLLFTVLKSVYPHFCNSVMTSFLSKNSMYPVSTMVSFMLLDTCCVEAWTSLVDVNSLWCHPSIFKTYRIWIFIYGRRMNYITSALFRSSTNRDICKKFTKNTRHFYHCVLHINVSIQS